MINIDKKTNAPILQTEIGAFCYNDILAEEINAIRNSQVTDRALWKLLVQIFRAGNSDDEYRTWKGEYWGKMMRAACFIYRTFPKNDEELYSVLEETVFDLISTADSEGRIASYSKSCEFTGWDLWCRKYVMLGLIYFAEICKNDSDKETIICALKAHADYIISKIGPGKEFPYITACTGAWDGLNSSSILEPFVLLYNLTGEKRYLDYSEYIFSCGGTLSENIFDLAFEDKVMLSEYRQPKAYEMISCFDGIAELSKITGSEKMRDTVIRFADRMMREESTVIGCLGTSSECLNHASLMQSDGSFVPELEFKGQIINIMQETCVTVTWMKFLWQLFRMTGDSKYMDEFEISMYNAMSGSLKEYDDRDENGGIFLPVHSYSPLRFLPRSEVVGGQQYIKEGSLYGCCVCISGAGFALDTIASAAEGKDGISYLNLYRSGTISFNGLKLKIETSYPYDSLIRITVLASQPGKKLALRIPRWSENVTLSHNGRKEICTLGYHIINVFEKDIISLEIPLKMRYIHPDDASDIPTGRNDYIALMRGPITYAYDYVSDAEPTIRINENITPSTVPLSLAPVRCRSAIEVKDHEGNSTVLVDYRSAGQTRGHIVSAWIKTQ